MAKIVQHGMFGDDRIAYAKGGDYKEHLTFALNAVKLAYEKSEDEIVTVFFSGGKDSTAVLGIVWIAIMQALIPRESVRVVAIDTLLSHHTWRKYVVSTCARFGLLSQSSFIFGDYRLFLKGIKENGYPYGVRGHKFGAYVPLKERAILRYVNRVRRKRGVRNITVLLGIRKWESRNREKRELVTLYKSQRQVCPILWWSERQVLDFLNDFNIPISPHYNDSVGNGDCLCNWSRKIDYNTMLQVASPEAKWILQQANTISLQHHGYGYGQTPANRDTLEQLRMFWKSDDGNWLCSSCEQ